MDLATVLTCARQLALSYVPLYKELIDMLFQNLKGYKFVHRSPENVRCHRINTQKVADHSWKDSVKRTKLLVKYCVDETEHAFEAKPQIGGFARKTCEFLANLRGVRVVSQVRQCILSMSIPLTYPLTIRMSVVAEL